MKLKIGFEYEQASIEDADRCRGLYIWDEETGLVVFSEDVVPTEEQQLEIRKMTNGNTREEGCLGNSDC